MQIDPRLAALRGREAPQRAIQQRMADHLAAWHGSPEMVQIMAELRHFGAGGDLADYPALAALFAGGDAAPLFVERMNAHFLPALRAEPLAQMPFRHFTDGLVSTMQLAQGGRAVLFLSAQEPGERDGGSVNFSHGERHEAWLAGAAQAQLVCLSAQRPDGADLVQEPFRIEPGCRLSLDLARDALKLVRIDQRLVALRLVRTCPDPQPTREYRLHDGTLLHMAAGDVDDSRHELQLAVLGRMGRADAAPVMAQMAREGSDHLRWQALRECLALDSAQGFAALCALARDPADGLARAAGSLRAQLIEAHPELLQLENV